MPDPLFLPGEVLPASKLQRLGDDDTYTPTLTADTTDPTLGTGAVQTGIIHLNGEEVTIWFEIVFGTSGAAAGSGNYRIPLPTAYPLAPSMPDTGIGVGMMTDASPAADRGAIYVADQANNWMRIRIADASSLVSNTNPWTWTNNDRLHGTVHYLTDFT